MPGTGSGNGVLLTLEKVCKSFGGLMAVNYASIEVRQGELRALIGPNGAGKTTLLNLITGIQTATAGRILFKGEDITRLPPDRISRRGISRTLQITSLFSGLTVYENIWAAAQSRRRFFNPLARPERWTDVREKTGEMLELTGLAGKAQTVCSELSYGDQRILEVGIALSTDPELLLLDEPTAGLSTRESMALVKRMRAMLMGQTIVLVEHDMGVVMELSDRITVLHYGDVLAEGTPAEIMGNDRVREVYLGK